MAETQPNEYASVSSSASSLRRGKKSIYSEEDYRPSRSIRLFSPPRQRQKWGSDHILPHVNWGDLFFDLFYVAAFSNMGHMLGEGPDAIDVLYFLTSFWSMLQMWNNKTFYEAAFVEDDNIFYMVVSPGWLLIVALASANIFPYMRRPKDFLVMFRFSLYIMLATFLHCFRYAVCYFFGRGQKSNIQHTALTTIKCSIIPLLCYTAAAIVSGMAYYGNDEPIGCESNHVPIILVLAGCVCHQLGTIATAVFFYPSGDKYKESTIPININFVIHRCGELTMLVLGEGVLSLILEDHGQHLGKNYEVLISGIMSVIFLQLLHFRSLPNHPEDHALYRRGKNASVIWQHIFNFYLAALLAFGASLKVVFYSVRSHVEEEEAAVEEEEAAVEEGVHSRLLSEEGACGPTLSYEDRKRNIAILFSATLAAVFWMLDLMHYIHVGLKEKIENSRADGKLGIRVISLVCRYAVTIFVATLFLWQEDPATLMQLGMSAALCQLIIHNLGTHLIPYMDDDEEVLDDSRIVDERDA